MCKHNAAIYGVEEFITTLCGDFFDFARAARENEGGESKWNGAERLAFDV